MAGLSVSENPIAKLLPHGFPKEVIDEFSRLTGGKVLCNLPYSGTDVIRDYGREQVETGALIVYTSADSVFQIAAHEDVVPPEQLYEYCRIARKLLMGEHGVGRVIARPFAGEWPYTRTPRRHDFSIEPPINLNSATPTKTNESGGTSSSGVRPTPHRIAAGPQRGNRGQPS